LPPLLEVRELSLRLGDFTLGKLSFSLERDDYMVLLGPSGCGKTSLLRTIAGVYRAAPGRLFLDGKDIGDWPPQRRRISYVSQTADLFPHLDVGGNIAFGLRYLGLTRAERRRRVERIADLFGIGSLLRRDATTLSGGEAKRAALARGLVVEPRILLLDEPLAGVDPGARAGMFGVLGMIHDELHTATIHVTHDRDEARAMGRRCAVMRAGRIEQCGSLEELFRAPRTRFVAEFLGEGTVFPARFVERNGRWAAVLDWCELPLDGPPRSKRGYVLVRPETLALRSGESEVVARGRVFSAERRGVYDELLVETAPGCRVRLHVAAHGPEARSGDPVELECAAAPCVIEGD